MQEGFLSVFWDVPKSTMHAVSDVGTLVEWLQEHIVFGQNSADNLAVLHNQNHMVHEFGLIAWVTQSRTQVISRSVTSCAGMAYMVVVAQTKVGFLTEGRSRRRAKNSRKKKCIPEPRWLLLEPERFCCSRLLCVCVCVALHFLASCARFSCS